MSLFSKSKEAQVGAEASIVFEVDKGYDRRLMGKSRPVSISVDGNPVVSLLPGESQEVKVTAGKRKFTFVHKDGKTHATKTISGNSHCFIHEDKDGVDIDWTDGGGVLSSLNGEKRANTGPGREVKVFFRAEAGLTGRDRKVDISVDGAHVATLGTGERYEHSLKTGDHVFQFDGEFSRQTVQGDLGCFIQIGRKVEYEFFDPKSLLARNRLRGIAGTALFENSFLLITRTFEAWRPTAFETETAFTSALQKPETAGRFKTGVLPASREGCVPEIWGGLRHRCLPPDDRGSSSTRRCEPSGSDRRTGMPSMTTGAIPPAPLMTDGTLRGSTRLRAP
ncbi:MAG: hypothetical protein J5674_05410 [Candidatus Methanomethylophilaceae archaeon]|nr:hypothetical protein [Candidatus Methanomethylophilaceae archaeon]